MVISFLYALFFGGKFEYFPKLGTGMDFILASIDD